MAAAIAVHHHIGLAFGILGNIISFFVYFSPMPTFWRIYKEKSTMEFDSLPYAVALFSAMLWMYYAFLKPHSFLLITINSFGCVIQTFYLTLYFIYASRPARRQCLKILGIMNVGALGLILGVSYICFEGHIRVQVVGWACVAVSVGVFAAPLRIVIHVVKTRSAEFMPFYLSFFLTLSAVMWFGYGIFQHDLCIAIPNVVGFALGLVQMLLFLAYREAKTNEKEGKQKEGLHERITVTVVDQKLPEDSRRCSKCQKVGGGEEEGSRRVRSCGGEAAAAETNGQIDRPAATPPTALLVCAA